MCLKTPNSIVHIPTQSVRGLLHLSEKKNRICTMNSVEYITIAFALLASYSFLRIKGFKNSIAVPSSLFLLPAFFATLGMTTQYMMIDETYILLEPLKLASSSLGQWKMGALRTTDISLGVIMHFIQLLFPLSEVNGMMILKALHWLFGLVLLIAVFDSIWKFFYPARKFSCSFFIFFLHCSLLFPVCAIALKIFNYDLLSMLLGILAITFLMRGWRYKSKRLLLTSVAVATLSAQEKLIASPVLWISLATYIGNHTDIQKISARNFKRILISSIEAIGVTFSVIIGSHVIVLAIQGRSLLTKSFLHPANILAPLHLGILPLLRLILGDEGISTLRDTVLHLSAIQTAALIGAGIILMLSAAIAVGWLIPLLLNSCSGRRATALVKAVPAMNGIIFIIITTLGIIATFTIRQYWIPVIMPSEGMYVPSLSFNSIVPHYKAPNLITHLGASIAFSYSVFVNAIPVVSLILMGVFFLRKAFMKNEVIMTESISPSIVTGASILIPALYGFTLTPVLNRYFNLFLYTVMAFTLFDFFSLTDNIRNKSRVVIYVAAASVLLLETASFRNNMPLFRPFWSSYPKNYMKMPVPGVNNPWSLGGGEELFLAGRKILKNHGSEKDSIRIYFNHYRGWIGPPRNVELIDMSKTRKAYRYTSDDYYVVNRLALTQGWSVFPYGHKPEFTVSLRGFVCAWVFRGDKLRKSGFSFN